MNFPDVRYVIHLGPARTIIDHVQQAGRAGRDGKPAYNVVISSGPKLAHCETAVKTFVKETGCLRTALFKPLDCSVNTGTPMHACCSNCCKLCKCNGDNCSGKKLPFNDADAEDAPTKDQEIM